MPPVKQRLIIGQTSTLYHYPRLGPPLASPAPVVTVYGAGDDLLTAIDATLSGATATLDNFDEELAADASKGATEITLASTSGLVVGGRYWLTSEKGEGQAVEIRGVDSTKAYLVDALKYDHDVSGATKPTLKGLRMSVPVDSSLLTDIVRGARVVWTYYYRANEPLNDVGRYDVVLQDANWPVTAGHLRAAWPAFVDHAGNTEEWTRLVDDARHDLESSLEASCLYADNLDNHELAARFIAARAIENYIGNNHADTNPKTLEKWERRSQREYEKIQLYLCTRENADNPVELAYA